MQSIILNITRGGWSYPTLALAIALALSSTTTSAADSPEAGDIAKGAQSWAENCTRCHNLRAPNELSDAQWITSVFHMRVKAGLTGQETRDILTFLQAANASSAQAKAQVKSDSKVVAQQEVSKIEK